MTATHVSGLMAHFDGKCVTIDPQTRDAVFAAYEADPELGPHARARVANLMTQAHRIYLEEFDSFKRRHKHRLETARELEGEWVGKVLSNANVPE
ncbi:MAG: hypothetical protein JNJ55_09815 [Betaproteobacteria bacterium]|nr:hypothetical protein [Betaproteobacteria bacterium]